MKKLFAIAAALLFVNNTPAKLEMPEETSGATINKLTPSLLKIEWTTTWTNAINTNDVATWKAKIPALLESKNYQISYDGTPETIEKVGISTTTAYAAFKKYDLHASTSLYIAINPPIKTPGKQLQMAINNPELEVPKKTETTLNEETPVIHINQAGYQTDLPKTARVGYYLGNLGELPITQTKFEVIDADTKETAYQGKLTQTPDVGLPNKPYQQVYSADFTKLNKPGNYCLHITGLGISKTFRIGPEMGALLARTYALGLFEQRCGQDINLPFTRFTHPACHTEPASVPDIDNKFVNEDLKLLAAWKSTNSIHNLSEALYPYNRTGTVDVAGGHHDAGDYSKYTGSAAIMAHFLFFAVDYFPGVDKIDNLGIPESGDGIPDLLQEGKIEADYLLKLQDTDGGFYSLVYPATGRYEGNLPQDGDTQTVLPKTTPATANAIALLAQAAASPTFKKAYPEAAEQYLKAALKGFQFLTNAFQKYGEDGACQSVGGLGNMFGQKDALAWAYTELYLATKDPQFHNRLKKVYQPNNPDTIHWGWERQRSGYGCANRSYAFAAKTGQLNKDQVDPAYLALCREQIIQWGKDLASFADDSAYGTSWPILTKQRQAAGWYFSSSPAFDIAVARELDPDIGWNTILSNLGYEAGCNPINQCYITGLGDHPITQIVNQYAANSQRQLPPTGFPVGNIRSGFTYDGMYKNIPPLLCYPNYYGSTNVYGFYDRYADTWNTSTEQVGADQSRALAVSALLMAQTPLANQTWKPQTTPIQIEKTPTNTQCKLQTTLNLDQTKPLWESYANNIGEQTQYTHQINQSGEQWIETEFLFPDGRRLFAKTNFVGNAKADPNKSTISFQVLKNEATPQKPGIIRIVRKGQNNQATTIKYQIISGASNGSDVGWLEGTHFNKFGVITLKPNQDHEDITVQPRTKDSPKTKTLRIQLTPGDYNIEYPNIAEVKILKNGN